MKLRHSPRLTGFSYAGQVAYSLTFVTRGRQPCLVSRDTVQICLDSLDAASGKYGFQPLAYCFMPDHAHLLTAGRSDESSLGEFTRHFKQISSFRFKRARGTPLWQISYYDHVLRRDEQVEIVARYIWDNPVRAGLVAMRMDYAFSGPRELMGDG